MIKNLKLPFLALVLAIFATPAFAVDVERVVSEQGIEAWLIRDTSNPITTVKFAFRGGSSLDPAEKSGLSRLAASTMDEGAGNLDSAAFQGALEDNSISLSFDTGLDTFRGTLRTLNENRDQAFDLLKMALTQPRFDAEPVERLRAQLISQVTQSQENPRYLSSRRIFEVAFEGHPYARSSDGTAETLAAITDTDLRDFVATRLARENVFIGVVGDIDAETLKTYLDGTFGDLPEKTSVRPLQDHAPTFSGGVYVIDVDVPQSAIQFAQPGIARDDEDFFTAYVLNYVLGGGGFVSRLYEEVREKRGLAYSVYSYLMPLQSSAMVLGGAGTANERVGETIETVQSVWRVFAENGPTEEELTDAKTFLTGNFPLRFTDSERIANMLVTMQVEDLGIDYIDRRNSYVEAVSMADAKRVAKQLFQPENLTFVIAGKPVGVTPTE
jgi:zinc protease